MPARSKTANELRDAKLRLKHMTPFAEWEAIEPKGVYTRTPTDLLHHPAFLDLTPAAKVTLIYMREEAAGEQNFLFTIFSHQEFISKDGFAQSVKQLVSHGFIEIAASYRHSKRPTEYRMCAAWKTWKPPTKKSL